MNFVHNLIYHKYSARKLTKIEPLEAIFRFPQPLIGAFPDYSTNFGQFSYLISRIYDSMNL